jgi:two-component system CheB/CheR fusion protein
MTFRRPDRSARKPAAGKPEAPPGAGGDPRHGSWVVGIGASAGGLEAYTRLFRALPPGLGMAYVLVPHLDPARESAITQILARTTAMPVRQIEDGMAAEPDHVYVIPPNCDLTMAGLRFHIAEREHSRPGNTSIDVFFRSLAAECGSNAIGVVLSGTASDGTVGLTAIKGEGGITFAQDSQSAKYDGMPASAIAAGCVDFVLAPEEIANELASIRQHRSAAGMAALSLDGEDAGLEPHLAQIFRLLRRATRVDFSEYKPPTISRRIQRRMVLHKVGRLADYVALLQRDRQELNALYEDLLINVTSFFRNPEVFEALRRAVYPEILRARNKASLPIRIWVPGCSTGEEAYSHAISLVEFLGDEHADIPIQIFGTDLSESAVQKARAAIFKDSIEADVSPTRLRRFFHKTDAGYQISKTIRDFCVFSTQNIFSDPPFSRMDLVSCRNVMIYLSQALQKRVIPIFHYALNPMGFLMIGNTEGLLSAGPDLFEMAEKKQKIYRRKNVASPAPLSFSMGMPEKEGSAMEAPVPPSRAVEAGKVPLEMQREADRLLLSRYAPPAVVVNDQMEILHSRGRTGHYLELPPGKASLNLLKMARHGLLFELQSAIDEARRTGVETDRQDLHVEEAGEQIATNIRIVPFRTPMHDLNNFLVVFEPTAAGGKPLTEQEAEPLTRSERTDKDKQLEQMRQELTATREHLQSIIEMQETTNEELQSANEEIQSGNEELQSTNEELQTSKEELESANEELHTVNEEMQHRNELLTQLNNDLTNLLNSVNLAMVMVSSDLSVRRFTPQATSVLGLGPSDIGRPIPRLRLKVDVRALEQMMLDVMQEVQAKQFVVEDNEGHRFSLRVTPYRSLDNRIDGAVLTVVDSPARAGEDGASSARGAAAKRKRAGR